MALGPRGRTRVRRGVVSPPGHGPLGVAVGRRWQDRQIHDPGLRLVLFLAGGPSCRGCDQCPPDRGDRHPAASATACNVAPALRRARMSAAMSSVNREGPLGPRLCQPSPAAPEASSSLRQRHSVTTETPNAAATSIPDAALIRTSWTAASRRPASSPSSHTKHSSPRMNTRPPSSSRTSAATAPNGTAPLGVRGRGGWAVTTPIIPTPISSWTLYKNYSSQMVENLTAATVFIQVRRLPTTAKPSLCPEPWCRGLRGTRDCGWVDLGHQRTLRSGDVDPEFGSRGDGQELADIAVTNMAEVTTLTGGEVSSR